MLPFKSSGGNVLLMFKNILNVHCKGEKQASNSTTYRMIPFCDKNINVYVCIKKVWKDPVISLGGWNLHVSSPSLCLYVFCDFFIMSINYFCSKKKIFF